MPIRVMSDLIYLRAYRGARFHRRKKAVSLIAVSSMAAVFFCAALVFGSVHLINLRTVASDPDAIQAPAAAQPLGARMSEPDKANAPEQDRLRVRNRRLEALVETLRKKNRQLPAATLKFEGLVNE